MVVSTRIADMPMVMMIIVIYMVPLQMGVALCWVAGAGLGMSLMFGFADKDMSLLSSALYIGLSRTAWALSMVWLMLACLSGNGGEYFQLF